MKIEKEYGNNIPVAPAIERKKNIEQLRLEEENRIIEIEQRIDNWAREFYAILKDCFLKNQNITPNFKDFNQNKISQFLQSFPRELVKTKYDLRYFLSRTLKSVGKTNINFIDKENGEDLCCYQKNINTLYSLVAEALGYKEVDIEKLINSKPVFYREDSDALRDIQISENVSKKLPSKFFQNPTKFIEALSLIERDEKSFAHDIGSLAGAPYDSSRVKRYKKLVFKRVDLSKVDYGIQEINEAQKIAKILKELGDSRIQTQKFIGFIYDQGNIYLVSEFIKGKNALDIIKRYGYRANYERGRYGGDFYEASEGKVLWEIIEKKLGPHHIDLESRNCIIEFKPEKEYTDPNSVKTITIIDFETKK